MSHQHSLSEGLMAMLLPMLKLEMVQCSHVLRHVSLHQHVLPP